MALMALDDFCKKTSAGKENNEPVYKWESDC